jgi:hypothetical protein
MCLFRRVFSGTCIICISLFVLLPCYAAPVSTPQTPQEFKEQAEKRQAEFEERARQNKAAFDAQAQKNKAEFDAQVQKSQAKYNAQVQNNKAEFDANAAKMRAESDKERQKMRSNFYMWAGFVGTVGILGIIFRLIKRRKRYSGKNRISNEQAILDAGIEGERQTAFHLSFLKEGYTILHNVTVRSDGLSAENDHVVIGSSGIILVETKNFGGTIYVRPNGWVREKFGKKQGCDSPIAQSERHKIVLENFLTKRGLGQVPIYIVVAIPNSQAIIEGEDPRCPVMKSENLPHWIRCLPPAISEEQINGLRNLFISSKKQFSTKPGEAQLESL